MAKSITVCGEPQQKLPVFPADASTIIVTNALTKLPAISHRIVSADNLAEDDANKPVINYLTISLEADLTGSGGIKANMLSCTEVTK